MTSRRMVDIHCHILPAVDDGPPSWEVAIEMCRLAWQDGITHIVATPHANSQFRYDRTAFTRLAEELTFRIDGQPTITLGCDFHFSYENFLAVIENPGQFTLGTTSYLLVELDDYSVPLSTSMNFEKLLSKGLVPILTHPERNPMLQAEPQRVLEWVQQGCLVQLTASSFTGRWGTKARSAAEWWLRRNAVHVIATDAHGVSSRPPILSEAREEVATLVGDSVAAALFTNNPLAIVNGEKPQMLSSTAKLSRCRSHNYSDL